jgi:hypothetical protein
MYGYRLGDGDFEYHGAGGCNGYFFRFADLYDYQCHPHGGFHYFGGNFYLDGTQQLYGDWRYGYRHGSGDLYCYCYQYFHRM